MKRWFFCASTAGTLITGFGRSAISVFSQFPCLFSLCPLYQSQEPSFDQGPHGPQLVEAPAGSGIGGGAPTAKKKLQSPLLERSRALLAPTGHSQFSTGALRQPPSPRRVRPVIDCSPGSQPLLRAKSGMLCSCPMDSPVVRRSASHQCPICRRGFSQRTLDLAMRPSLPFALGLCIFESGLGVPDSADLAGRCVCCPAPPASVQDYWCSCASSVRGRMLTAGAAIQTKHTRQRDGSC